MTISDIKKQELQTLLSLLSDNQVEKLVTVMDASRSEKSMASTSELIMSMLRPSLLHTKPRRLQTPQRILCDPFEDLLVSSRSMGKDETRISRTSIAPIWDWIQEIGGASFAEICNAFEKAITQKNEDLQWKTACEIWDEADRLLRPEIDRAYEDAGYNSELSEKFGDSNCIDDMREMLELIQIGSIIETLKKELPAKPIMKMSEAHIELIRKRYLKAIEVAPASGPWLIISVMRRLFHEAEILKVVKSLSCNGDDTLASMTDLSIVGDLVIGEVEGFILMIEQIVDQKDQDLEVMELAKEYVASFSEVTSNLDIKREGEWGLRMLSTRKKVGNYITKSVLSDGKSCVMDGFRMTRRKIGKTVSKVIDLRAAPDIEKYRISERRTKAIKQCYNLADRIGLKSVSQTVISELTKELEHFQDKLIDILDRVAIDEREIATKHVVMVARIQEILTGPEEADLFRKRALGILNRPARD